jgi:hypothetical protein
MECAWGAAGLFVSVCLTESAISRTTPTGAHHRLQAEHCPKQRPWSGRPPSPRPASSPVRDSKDPSGPVLGFPAAAFASFVAGVKAGEFVTV